jgi:hypothetical protein
VNEVISKVYKEAAVGCFEILPYHSREGPENKTKISGYFVSGPRSEQINVHCDKGN